MTDTLTNDEKATLEENRYIYPGTKAWDDFWSGDQWTQEQLASLVRTEALSLSSPLSAAIVMGVALKANSELK